VSFIWFGGLLVAFGGIIALIGRMFRRAKKPAKNKGQTT
jgi:cytochrome c biogenesis factor